MSAAFLCSCAHTYRPPDPTKLNASTARLSKAVNDAHATARKAQGEVDAAAKKAKEVEAETRKLKDVPPTVFAGLADLQTQLRQAQTDQILLEAHFKEADAAKAQVEADKTAYFAAAKTLADKATKESAQRAALQRHSILFKLGAALALIIIIGVVVLVITGKLGAVAAGIAAKFP